MVLVVAGGGAGSEKRKLERAPCVVSCGTWQAMLRILNFISRKYETDFNQEHDMIRFIFC